MKKIIIIISIVVFVAVALIYHLFFSMSRLPTGDLISSHTSPDGKYTVNTYLCRGSATSGYSIRGEVIFESTGNKKNIYWRYNCNTAKVKWLDEHTVSINDIILDVRHDVYDWRRES